MSMSYETKNGIKAIGWGAVVFGVVVFITSAVDRALR